MTPDFHRILIPLDGSELAEAVLPFAIGLASRAGGVITLLHVLERKAPDKVHGQRHLQNETDALAYLDKVGSRCTEAGVRCESHVHAELIGDVAASIAAHAEELGIDLIAISTHGSSGMRGLLLGDIAQQTLRRSNTSLLLVKPDEAGVARPFECHEVLLALDPAVHGDVALPTASWLARACHAKLRLVTVIPQPSGLPLRRRAAAIFSPASTRAVLELEREDAIEYLEEKQATLSRDGIECTAEVRDGDPVEEVAGMLQRRSADLLILATHGQVGLGALLAGSFGPRILMRARYPVLLVRATSPTRPSPTRTSPTRT
jgi:nucleotide-binding universal stress UspA family protein